jgi:excisionase family DNA binding protein
MSATDERLLSLEDVADRLQVSDQSVRRWIKAGRLAAYKPGLEWRIRPRDLEDFLEARSYVPKAQAAPSSDEQAARPEVKALSRWLAYLEHRLDLGDLTRDEIAHELDAASAFGIRKAPSEYPDNILDAYMGLLRRALDEGKRYDELQEGAAALEAELGQLEEAHAKGQRT